mmetsp:Transcript_18796/g.33748  ORF Transcript_18796/g.33748 Transcript_18796/m.33748 type:complete len:230 (-) Transcript_18796:11-700(-)
MSLPMSSRYCRFHLLPLLLLLHPPQQSWHRCSRLHRHHHSPHRHRLHQQQQSRCDFPTPTSYAKQWYDTNVHGEWGIWEHPWICRGRPILVRRRVLPSSKQLQPRPYTVPHVSKPSERPPSRSDSKWYSPSSRMPNLAAYSRWRWRGGHRWGGRRGARRSGNRRVGAWAAAGSVAVADDDDAEGDDDDGRTIVDNSPDSIRRPCRPPRNPSRGGGTNSSDVRHRAMSSI